MTEGQGYTPQRNPMGTEDEVIFARIRFVALAVCLCVCIGAPAGAHAHTHAFGRPPLLRLTDVDGQWVTNFGTLTLAQDGDEIRGTYVDSTKTGSAQRGTIEGALNGNTFQGQWSSAGRSGEVTWDFDSDQRTFLGSADTYSSWCGAREGQAFPADCAFAGRWSADLGANGTGTLTLSQTGPSASGSFSSKLASGKVSGKVSYATGAPVLSGRWTAGRGMGTFKIALVSYADEQFVGSADNRTPWCGWRGDAEREPDALALSEAQRVLLGCATAPPRDRQAVTQLFDDGFMVVFNESGSTQFGSMDTQRFFAVATDGPDAGKAWRVLFPRGTKASFSGNLQDNQYDCEIDGSERPEVTGIPWRGFGMAWCRNPDISDALGGVRKAADNAEQAGALALQRYGCGLAFEFDGRPYALSFGRCEDATPGLLTGVWR